MASPASAFPLDSTHAPPPPPPNKTATPSVDLYHTRFEIECEFVACLANPYYLQHLAAEKYFDDPRFVRYLHYLQYWRYPPYLQYLTWPGPTLRHLELLQEEAFRQAIISPEVVARLEREGIQAGFKWGQQA
ncbi:soh1 family protein [Niveomyces insectorum RCEF 264]|uniref:Mediator of RNA polymerase II transcription subunit 31 n=1 Tax=Niveomyces insectorum RCEF 264 TaxID=1081102 RepID=A0A167VCK2_9HYPO|nr:soh1 family protein [Niveomyces insectorum RCEF 264]